MVVNGEFIMHFQEDLDQQNQALLRQIERYVPADVLEDIHLISKLSDTAKTLEIIVSYQGTKRAKPS